MASETFKIPPPSRSDPATVFLSYMFFRSYCMPSALGVVDKRTGKGIGRDE